MILLAAVRARLRPGAVRTGTAFAGFTESPSGVVVRVRDRSSGTLSDLSADALAGADGLYSGVRAQLHPVSARAEARRRALVNWTVSVRAPDGFGRIEAVLNSRPSLTP